MISVEGQKKLYYYIKSNVNNLSYLKWNKIPSFEDLWKTLNLAYKFLENNNNEKFAKLQALMSLDIVNMPLKEVIYKRGEYIKKTDSNKNFHERAIEYVLKFVRNDANYKIPKLLSVVESIQRYVFENIHNGISGDYSIFSSLLENGEISENFRFLVDYGVPLSAVKKIEVEFNKSNKENYDNIFILQWLKQNINIFNSILLEYEYNLLKKSLNF